MVERQVRYERGDKEFDEMVKKRRAALAKAYPDFRLVRDIDDAHKHLELTRPARPNRLLTSSNQIAVRNTEGSWGGSWGSLWGESWGATSAMVVRLDDGTQRPLSLILDNVTSMWERILRGE